MRGYNNTANRKIRESLADMQFEKESATQMILLIYRPADRCLFTTAACVP